MEGKLRPHSACEWHLGILQWERSMHVIMPALERLRQEIRGQDHLGSVMRSRPGGKSISEEGTGREEGREGKVNCCVEAPREREGFEGKQSRQ